MRIAVIGCGRAGASFALALARLRRPVSLAGIHSRDLGGARSLARRCGGARVFPTPGAAVEGAEAILICVPDRAIGSVASIIARQRGLRGKVVLHVSGALDLSPLEPAARAGAAVGSLHPLAVFPPAASSHARRAFERPISFAIQGGRKSGSVAKAIVLALSGVPLGDPGGSRAAYHLAATVIANDVTVLAGLALSLLKRRTRLSPRQARAAFVTLLRTAADRVEEEGAEEALTGPAARGDLDTLRRHLRELRGAPPALGLAYRILGREAILVSRRRGTLGRAAATRAMRLLGADARTR